MASQEEGQISYEDKPKFWPSSVALAFGWVFFLAGVGELSQPPSTHSSDHLAVGSVILLGVSAYRSAKRRRFGMRKNSWYRLSLEWIAIGLIILKFLFTPPKLQVEEPFSYVMIPALVVVGYIGANPIESKRKLGLVIGIVGSMLWTVPALFWDASMVVNQIGYLAFFFLFWGAVQVVEWIRKRFIQKEYTP